MNTLAQEFCQTGPELTALSEQEADALLESLEGWSIEEGRLCKTLHFADYYQTLAFVNALAWVAHRHNHHPDLNVHYNRVEISFSTHDVNGLSRNDFICAAKVEGLLTL